MRWHDCNATRAMKIRALFSSHEVHGFIQAALPVDGVSATLYEVVRTTCVVSPNPRSAKMCIRWSPSGAPSSAGGELVLQSSATLHGLV